MSGGVEHGAGSDGFGAEPAAGGKTIRSERNHRTTRGKLCEAQSLDAKGCRTEQRDLTDQIICGAA